MFYSTNLSKEASTLTKWLVSIPSVAHAKGPSLINQAIYEGLREFPYFKNHQNHLTLIAHDDGSYSQADLARPHSKSSVVALVKSLEEVSDTLVLLCDTDTSSPYHYGMFKGSSTSCDDLALKLRQLAEQGALSSKIEHLLKNDNALFGLGILESKCATGAMIAVLKELSDNYVHLNLNILFVCTCESSLQHRGIKQCIPFINKLCEDENLKLRLAVNAKPNTPTSRSDRNLHLYSGSYGKIEPSFYIIGHSATAFRPYEGFSASIIASELIRELELNPKLTQRLHHKPLVPTFDSLRVKEFGKDFSPDGMQVSFSLPLLDIDLGDLLEVLKEVAATAIEHAAELVDHRESSYAQIMHEDFIPEAKDAEVISFSDLVERTRHNFSGNLDKALSSMVQKCRHEGLSLHQASITIIERLNEIAHLPRPSIVIYYTDNYVPPMSLATNDSSDRELLRLLNGVIVKMRDQGPFVPTLAPYYAPTDGNFLRPEGHDAAFDILNEECPVRAQELNTLQVPTITLGIQGDDLTLLTEHVTRDMCSYVPSFLLTLVDLLAQPENALGLEYHDDLQRHLDALGRKAETIASASVREIQTINQQNASTGFYAQVNQGTLTPHSLSTFLHQFQQNNQAGGAPALEHKAPLGLPLNPDSAAASAAATSAEFAPDTELAPSSELMTKQLTVTPKTADTQEAEEPAEPQEPQSTAPDNKAAKGNKAVRAVKSLFKKAQEAKQALEDNIQANSVEQSADAPISLVASHHYKGKSQPETAAPAVPSAIDVALEAASAIAQMVNQDQPNTATAQPEFAPDADADAELTIIPVASVANPPPATVSAAAEQPTPSTEPAATDSARTNNAAQPAAAQTAEPKSKQAKGKKKKKAAKHAQERTVAEKTSAQGKIDLAAQAAEVKTEGSLEITNAMAVPSADKAEAKIDLPKDTKQDKTAQSEAKVAAKIEAPEVSKGKAEASLETTQVPAADSGAAEQDKATELKTKTEPEVSVGKAEATLETTQVSEADSGAAEQDKATELETKAEPEKVSASAAKATLETTQVPAADSDAAKQDKAAELETKAEPEKVSASAAKATLETTQVPEADSDAAEQDKATELKTKAEPEKVSASAAKATLETTQVPEAVSDAAEQNKATAHTKPAVAPSGFFAQALAATSAPAVEQAEDKAQTAAEEAESSTHPAATSPALDPEAEAPTEAQAEVTEAKTEASADAAAGSESKREGSDLGSDLKSAVDTAVDSIESALSSSLSKVSSFFKGKSKLKSSLAKLQEQVKETIEQEKPKAEHHILTSPEPELNLEQVTNLKPLPEPDTKRADDQAYVPVLPTLPEFKGESAPRPEAEPQAPAAVEATAAAAAPAASASPERAPEVDESLERELEALVQTQSEDATDAVIAALHQDDAAAKTIEVAVPQAPLFDLEQLTTAQVPAPEPAPEPVPKPKAEPEQTATEASSGNTIITRRTLVKPSAPVFISAQEHRAAAQPAERKEQPKEPTQDQPQDQSKPQAKAPEVNADMVAQLMAEAVSKKFKEHKLAQIDPLRSYSENQEPFADAIYANDINVDLPSSQMFDPTSDTALEADALSQEIQSKTGPLQTTPKSVAEVPPRLEVQPEPAAQPANTPSRELQTPQTVAKPQAQGFAPDADAMLQPLTAAAAPSAPLNQLFAQAQKELQGSAVARHLRAAHEPFAPDAPESAPAHYEFAPDRPAAPNAEPSADDLIAAQGQAQVEQVAAEPVTSKAKTKLTAALDAELAPAADEGPTLKRYDPAQAYAELLLDDDEQYRQHAAHTIDQKAQAKAQQAQAKQQALDAATATALGDMLNDDFSAASEAPRTHPTQRAARPSGQSLSERRAALRRAMYGDEVESAPVSKPTERRGSYIDLNQQGKVVSYNPAELTQTLGAHTQSTTTSGVVGAAHAGPVGTTYDSMVQGTVQGAAATAPRTYSYRSSAPAYGTPSRTMQAPPPAAGQDSGNGLGHAAGNAASSAAGNARPVSSVNYGSSRMSTTRSTMNPSVQRPTTTRTTPHSSHRFSPNSRLGILDDEPMVGNSGRSLRRANTTLNSSKPATPSSADSTSRTTTTKRAEPVRSTTRAATTSRTPSRSTGTKVETLASSNPGVRILRTTTTQPAAPVKPVRPRNEVVYSQGGAVVISQRITADQASSLLNQHHESKESHEPTAPTAIEGSTAELRRSAEQSLNTSFKRLQEDKSISGTIVIRSDQNKRPR